jgi:hypothetical protein
MASAAAAKNWPRPSQRCTRCAPTSRKYASWTRAVARNVWPGFSWANLWAASFRSAS